MSYLPPVLVGHSITVAPGHTVINLEFNEEIERGSGTIIVTDGALQTVIDRSTGLPATRIVGATDTRQIPLGLVGIDGSKAAINVDGLLPGHGYRVFILPGVLQSNGQPFAGVANGSLLAFTSGAALDTTPPGLTQMSLDHWAFNTTNASAHLTLAFTEKVAFTQTALHATGLTFANLASADGGLTWTADVAAQPNVDVSSSNISLDMSMVKDLAGNAGSGFQLASYNIDTKLPTVSSIVLANATPSLSAGATVTVKFSETVHNLGTNVIVAPHAVVSDLHTTDGGITWVASLAPGSGGGSSGNQLYVDLTQLSDLSGNAGTGTVNAPLTYDVAAPVGLTASITLSDTRLNQKSGAVTATIQFNQAVKGLDISDFHFTNADLTSLTTTDNITWHGTLTSHANIQAITNTFSLDLGMVQDSAGNYGSGTVSVSGGYLVDTLPPTVSLALDSASITATHGITLTATFSEPVQALAASYFTTPGATLSNLVSSANGTVWTATLTGNGTSSTGNNVSLDMTKVQDANGNIGTGSAVTTSGYSVDNTLGPTIAFDHGDLRYGGDIHATISFATTMSSLPIGALAGQDVTIIDEGHTDSNGMTTWHLTLEPKSAGVVSASNVLSLDMSKVTDSGGHAGIGMVTSPTYSIDSMVAAYVAGIRLENDTGVDGVPTTASDFVTNNPLAQFDGVLSAGLSGAQQIELQVDGSVVATGDFSDGSAWYYRPTTAPSLPDGTHTVTVRVVENGHYSAPLTQTFVVDHAAPGQPLAPVLAAADDSGTSNSDGITSNTSLHLSGTGAEAYAWVFLYETDDPVDPLAHVQADKDGNWQTVLNVEGFGTYLLGIKQQDKAGNESVMSGGFKLVVDRSAAALAAPVLDAASDKGSSASDGVTNDQTPIFNGTGAEPFATIKLFSDGAKVGEATADGEGSWSIKSDTISTEGIHHITATQTDRAGNVSDASADFELDIVLSAPSVTAPTTVETGGTYSLKFSDLIQIASSIGEVDVYKGTDPTPVLRINPGDAQWITEASGNSKYNVLKLTGLADGDYTLHFTFTSPVNVVGIAAANLLHDITFHVGPTL